MKKRIIFAALGICVFSPLAAPAQTAPPSATAPSQAPELGKAPYRKPLPASTTGVQPQIALPQVVSPSTLSVDTSIRRASRNFFNSVYSVSDGVAIDWTGNEATGTPGTTALDFQDAVALRVNFLRALAGVPAIITLNSSWSAEDQQAALMMSANNELDHYPPTTWIDYTAQGAQAAGSSDLYLGEFGPDAMTGYIQDPGSNNLETGHRRWVLYPPTEQMGTGDIPPNGTLNSANALWVIDVAHAYPALRDGFVAWPPKGYVPYQLIFPRWSFSLLNADFSASTVSVTLNGTTIPTVIESSTDDGYGDNTLVWYFSSTPDGSPPYPQPSGDTTYSVTVSHVVVGGVSSNYTYPVTVFDPAVSGPDDILPTLTAPATVGIGSATNLPFTALPEATGYQVWSATLQPVTWVEGAETLPLHLTPQTTGTYDPIDSTTAATGSNCFHLVQDEFMNQDLLLNSQFVASASSSISFATRYAYMFPTEFAMVQVSTDDGSSWATVFSRPGNSSDTGSFSTQSVSLAAYAGRIIRIRFLLDYTGGEIYDGTANNVGWLIDNITPVNLQEASSVTETPITSSPYSFVAPVVPSTVYLAVQAILFDAYPAEFGPVTTLGVIATSTTPVITSPWSVSGTVGVPFSPFTVTSTAAGSPVITYGATGLPPGLSLDANTGIISGTPTQAGMFSAILNATNTTTNDIGTSTLTVTIAKATATAVLGNLSPTYNGNAHAATAVTTPSGLTVSFTYNGSTTAPTNAGSYAVIATVSDPNYQGTATGTLVIAQATLTDSLVGPVSKAYDGTATATLSGGNYTLSAPFGSDVVTLNNPVNGNYSDKNVGTSKQVTVSGISLSGASASNYQLSSPTLSASVGAITAAPLTVTANPISKVYNGLAYTGGNGVTISGFVHAETSSVLGGTLTYAGNSQGAVGAGSYAITPGGLTSTNYTINFVNGTLTVVPAPLTVALKAGSSIYGQTITSVIPGLSITGFVNGETIANLGYTSVITGTGAGITSTTDAGSYKLTIGGALTDANYVLKTAASNPVGKASSWTVTQDVLTVNGLNGASIYGQTPSTPGQIFTIVSSNGITSQTALLALLNSAPVTTAYTFNITNTTTAGKYTTDKIVSALLAAGLSTKDYKLVIGAAGAWTVTPDLITIAGLTNGSSIYGSAPVFNGTSYFTISDQDSTANVANLVKNVKATLSATATSNAATYSVPVAGVLNTVGTTVNGVSSSDYKVVLVPGSWKVNPQPVTITIGGGSSVYGVAPKVPTLTATGVVNGKNTPLTSVLLKGLSTNLLTVVGKTGNAGVGGSPYTFTLTGTPTGNYTYTGVESATTATWTITQATITAIRINASSTSTFGSEPIDKALTVTGLVNGDLPDALGYTLVGVNGNLTAATVAGTYTFTVGGSLTDANYLLKAGVGNPPVTPAGSKVVIK